MVLKQEMLDLTLFTLDTKDTKGGKGTKCGRKIEGNINQGKEEKKEVYQGREMYALINELRPRHLTIGDLKKLDVGDELDVVMWDYNFEEKSIWSNPSDTPYPAEEFFSANRVKVKWCGNSKWEIMFYEDLRVIHDIEIALSDYIWTSLYSNLDPNFVLEDLPDDIRVGWRGPMMLWKNLKNVGQIFYERLT